MLVLSGGYVKAQVCGAVPAANSGTTTQPASAPVAPVAAVVQAPVAPVQPVCSGCSCGSHDSCGSYCGDCPPPPQETRYEREEARQEQAPAPAPAPAVQVENVPQQAYESFFDWGPPPSDPPSCNECYCGGPCESRWDYFWWD